MDLFNRSGARHKLIAALNLEPFVNRAVDIFGLKSEDVESAMREYRHFLYLAYWNRRLEEPTMVVPTVNADKIWHTHILFTRDYREMCDRVFGRYLDHHPGLKEGTRDHTVSMQHTRQVHKRIRQLGKEPGFDEGYFSFLDPKPAPRPVPAPRPSASSRTREDSRSRRSDRGGDSGGTPLVDSHSGFGSFGSPGESHSDHGSSSGHGSFGGGDFGGGGASGSWGGGSSSDSGGGGGSSCGGGGGGGD